MSDQPEKKPRLPKPGDIVIGPQSYGFNAQSTMEGFPGEVFFEVKGRLYKTMINNSDTTKVTR